MKYALFGGEVVNAAGITKGTVIVEEGRITSIEKDSNKEHEYHGFDASDYYILPGIIDLNAVMDHSVSGFQVTHSWEQIQEMNIKNGITSVCLPYRGRDEIEQATNNYTYRYELKLKELTPQKAEQLTAQGFHQWVVYCDENDDLWHCDWERIHTVIAGKSVLIWFKFFPELTIRGNTKRLHQKLLLKPSYTHTLYNGANLKRFADDLIELSQTFQIPIGVSEMIAPQTISRLMKINSKTKIAVNLPVPYVQYSAESYALDDGTDYMCLPPLLNEKERETLIKQLSTDAFMTLSTYSTMLSGRDRIRLMKNLPNRFGVNKEDSFSTLLKLVVAEKRLNINKFVRMTSHNPARLIGCYPQKGAILPGSDADFILVNRHSATIDYVFIHGLCVKKKDSVTLSPGIGGRLHLNKLKRFIC